MTTTLMHLKIVLPHKVLLELGDIASIVVDTPAGSHGLLPRRLDCVSAVVPGILAYQTATGAEVFVAHDKGVLIKHGMQVSISVRRAFAGADLALMQRRLNEEILEQGEAGHAQHQLQTRMEAGFLRRFAELRNE